VLVLGAPEEAYGVKLLDYGLAQLWDDPEPEPEAPGFDGLAYLAPEQILLEPADPRVDVYALGMLLYRMLVGHSPFEASEGPLLRHQLFSHIPQATWLEAGLDPRLEALILNATRKRPENRYSSVTELLADLDAVIGLAATSVEIRPLERNPDDYEPQTSAGQRSLDRLRHRFSSVPPSSTTLSPG
jgi:serine/threonine-protein kinase